jgi:hypothetical protein
MFKITQKYVLEPIFRRVGTATASFLVSVGLSQDLARPTEMVIVAVLGVGLDLVNSYFDKNPKPKK